jgi:ADP-heptose:LPS heptosyltransferase
MKRPTVLMLRPLGLGDLLTIVPALRAVAKAFPFHERILAAPRSLAPLARLTGAIDRVVPAEPMLPLPADCNNAEVAIDFHGRGPGSHRVLLATQPQRLIAFENAAVSETRGFPQWRDGEHEVERWCRLLIESGIPADPTKLDLRPPPGDAPGLARGAILIHPGAGYPARRWPVERWAAVARLLAPNVIITGSRGERELACRVAEAGGLTDDRVFAGRTDVMELARIVSVARLVVCPDTGIAHLATALGTPSVVLFGPSPPSRWGPPPDRLRHRVIWNGREGDPNGSEPDPGLLSITVDDVLAAVEGVSEAPHALRA